jgi:methionyl-tRNA formyltransferase
VKSIAFVGAVKLAAECCRALYWSGVEIGQIVGWPYDPAVSGWEEMPNVCKLTKECGLTQNIVTKDINAPEVVKAIGRCDLLVCGGWSRLFSKELLMVCPLGAVNLHPTLLPIGRGRAPIPWTIINGLKRSGVTLHYMTEGCDDGDIIGQEAFDIDPDETAETLYRKATNAAAKLCREFVPRILDGSAPRIPQDHSLATVWPKRSPEDSDVSRYIINDDALWRHVRALDCYYPRAYILVQTSNGPRKVYLSTHEDKFWPGTTIPVDWKDRR